jgi:GT2 family glycosyltransferase
MLTINRVGGAILRRLSLKLPESMPPVIRGGHHDQIMLPELKPLAEWPTVDIVTVFYNGERHVDAYLKAIRELDYPKDRIHLFLVDNGSTDATFKLLLEKTQGLAVTLVPVGTNKGFTGGCNLAMRACQDEYILLLNPDTRAAPDALKTLVMRAKQERGVGMVEAAQQPVEHPKWFDQQTQETPWCSGAVTLIWRRALLRTGVFDERLFMYCEDIDLSWRMWSRGYRCVYEPRAKVWHEQGSKSHKGGEREYYLAFRNGLMLRFVYGGMREYLRYAGKMLRIVFLQSDHSLVGKRLLLRALVAHLRNIPHLLRRRREQAAIPRHRWIQFVGWDYHIRRW